MARRRRSATFFPSVDHFIALPDVGVRGATEKDVLEDPETGLRYIAKLGGRNNDLEVMTEYAIHLIGRSLGVLVADARVARFKGRLRFMSCYFLDIKQAEELVHGMQLFSELYDETSVQATLGKEPEEQSLFSVQAVKAAFGAHYMQYGPNVEDQLFDGFVEMLTHDALIGVQDRHHENWGVIVQRSVDAPAPRFAPLYDSARGLFCNIPDGHLTQFSGVKGLEKIDRYVGKSRPLVGFKGLMPRPGRTYVTHDQLLAAVFRDYPAQRARISTILEAYDWRQVSAQLTENLSALCSPPRRALILTCLRRRLKAVYRAIAQACG